MLFESTFFVVQRSSHNLILEKVKDFKGRYLDSIGAKNFMLLIFFLPETKIKTLKLFVNEHLVFLYRKIFRCRKEENLEHEVLAPIKWR